MNIYHPKNILIYKINNIPIIVVFYGKLTIVYLYKKEINNHIIIQGIFSFF